MARNKGHPRSQKYMFILQLLDKESLCPWESFLFAAPNNNEKNSLPMYGKPLKAPSGKLQASEDTSNRPLTASTSKKMVHRNGSIANLHTRVTVLLDKCNYIQCCMNTRKVDYSFMLLNTLPSDPWPGKSQLI